MKRWAAFQSNSHALNSMISSLAASYTDARPSSPERNGFRAARSMHLGSKDIKD